jgi:hypothetical protein
MGWDLCALGLDSLRGCAAGVETMHLGIRKFRIRFFIRSI